MRMRMWAVALFTLLIVIFPQAALSGAKKAYSVCESTVIPSLFPFFVCSNLLTALGFTKALSRITKHIMSPCFKVGENCSLAVIMGIVSGYPVGAKTAVSLKEKGLISKSEAEKILAFCNNSGPLFILGAVGSGMLSDAKAGFVIYAAHIAAAITASVIMRNVKCDIKPDFSKEAEQTESFGEALSKSIAQSMDSVFLISGFVIISAILLEFINLSGIFGIFGQIGKCAIFGLVEPSNGCIAVAEAKALSITQKCMAVSAVVGWSGISVHLQVAGIVKKENLSLKYYFWGKVISMLTSPVYAFLFCRVADGKVIPFGIHMRMFGFSCIYPIALIMIVSLLFVRRKNRTIDF